MEGRRRLAHVTHRKIGWEERIERLTQLRRGEPPRIGETDHLPRCVHAGIRPACPVDSLSDPVTEAGQRGLQDPLDRPASRLNLEAIKVRSVIFDPSAVAHGDALSSAYLLGTVMAAEPRSGEGAIEHLSERTLRCVSEGAEMATHG
jgi:hypothetical protein